MMIDDTGMVRTAWMEAAYGFTDDSTAVRAEMTRPSVLMRPRVYMDGNAWCALYGDNIMEGVVGFGETPELAAKAFDAAWKGEE
jgi:hypothetical protein